MLLLAQDASGHELDCIIDNPQHSIPIEIKSGQTIATDFFKELTFWKEKTEQPNDTPQYLIYGGYENQKKTYM